MTTFLSLLRGINVGGNRKVKMDALKAVHAALGHSDVLTYIQSGNVIFKSDITDISQLQQQIADNFATTFGFHSEVIIRTSDELNAIIAQNPFQNQPDRDPKWIAVLFLATLPTPTAQEALRASYTGPEEIFCSGKEVYIYYPDGIGRSKLSHSFLEKKLQTSGTARNLNTILKLQELSQK
jgi:uncharacterized protein (DUF1697 family)